MTTKPKAKKFRIKRSSPAGGFLRGASTSRDGADAGTEPADAAAPPDVSRPAPPERPATRSSSAPLEGQPATSPSQQTTAGEVTSARMAGAEAAIDEIRREGLTGRQLRMARRVAQKHNLPATSDFDAVRLLRAQGIDPFKPTNMLELVVPKAGAEQHEGGAPDAFENLPAQPGGAGSGRVQLPQTVPVKQNLPSTDLSPSDRRQKEISEIQRDIARRRRRNLAALLARLSFFVFLPTAVAAWYFYSAATPMYSTKSEFLILQADNVGGSGLGGLLSGTQFATNQDSIAVQSFLQSKEVMLRLDEEVGYKTHFTQSWIDPIARLSPDATNEETYKVYKKRVKIGYDPTEGVIRMEVIAADPEVSAEFSRRLISYAEARVNDLSQQKRGDQMQDALESFQKAEVDRRAAQQSLVELQQQGAILDPEAVIVGLRGQINTLETQLQERELELAALLDNTRPNRARVEGAQADIRRMNEALDKLNQRMIDASKGENSLAQLAVRIQMAQADLATRDMMLQSALQQVEQTRLEANRQVRYLTTSVEPVASQAPSYPRAFENTLLAFLVFSGIYLMFSLTSSILREQVSQ